MFIDPTLKVRSKVDMKKKKKKSFGWKRELQYNMLHMFISLINYSTASKLSSNSI